MLGFVQAADNTIHAYKPLDLEPDPKGPRIFRQINRDKEGYWEFHIHTKNHCMSVDKIKMTAHCVDLIHKVGGEIREDWRMPLSLVLFTLPPGVANPIKMEDPVFRNKIVTRYWQPLTDKERAIFALDG